MQVVSNTGKIDKLSEYNNEFPATISHNFFPNACSACPVPDHAFAGMIEFIGSFFSCRTIVVSKLSTWYFSQSGAINLVEHGDLG